MAQPTAPSSQPQLLAGPRWQNALGILLLLAWLIWWGLSLSLDVPRLVGADQTYLNVGSWPYIGIDFLHEYSGGYALSHGTNPYEFIPFHPLYKKFTYPPVILPFFLWCGLLPPQSSISIPSADGQAFLQPNPVAALYVWLAILTGIFTWATWIACQQRRKLNYGPLAFLFSLPLILLSFPVIFAMERGSSDALMLLFILLGGLSLQRKTLWWDLVAGFCFAIAAWMKLYPGFLILALIALRRWRAAGFMIGGIAIIGLATFPWVIQWITIVRARLNTDFRSLLFSHSLSNDWHRFWATGPLSFLAQIPGPIGAGLIVLTLAAIVGWFVFRNAQRESFIIPYLLWMTALSTFWPLISFDYNLIYLPLAALILWRRRDPMWVHMLLAFFLFWWQPLVFPQTQNTALVFKFLGVLAIGLSLIAKLRAPSSNPHP